MAGTYYKYAERDADSEINWAEVGKGLSDMLAETNKVREEKKTALDEAQRQTMAYLAQTPNGEDATARTAALEYANQAANRMRIAKQQMEQGQISVKDYTIFRQNLTDNTNLLFNANKAYQEEYARKMQRKRDGISSALEPDRMKDAEMFGNWSDTGFFIGPNGVVMAGKMVEKDVDGKKVRALDETPGNLRNIDAINQLILGDVDKYDWEGKANEFVDALGKNVQVTTVLGKIGTQGLSRSLDDITKRKDIIEADKQIMYNFVQSENDKIKEIAGTDIDKARILMDSAILAPNMQPYTLTNDPKEAAKGVNYILKEYDPSTRGVVYKISDAQSKDAEEFIRTQMRAKYNVEEKEDVVGQVSRDEKRPKTSEENQQANMEKDARNFAVNVANLQTGSAEQVAQSLGYFRGLGIDINRNPKGKPPGIYVRNKNGELVKFKLEGDTKSSTRGLTGALLSASESNLPEDMVVNFAFKNVGKQFNTRTSGTGKTIDRDAVVESKLSKISWKLFNNQNSNDTASSLKELLAGIPGVKISAEGGGAFKGNKITITKPGSTPLEINSNMGENDSKLMKEKLKTWLGKNLTDNDKKLYSGDTESTVGELD